MKRIIIISVVILSIFLIYLSNIDKKVYYLNLGDFLLTDENNYVYMDDIKEYLSKINLLEKYNNYGSKDMRSTDLINMIDNNYKNINGEAIKNALIKADLLTLSIGFNDLHNKIYIIDNINEDELYNYVDGILLDIDILISKIRVYCKEDIIVIGYYNPLNANNNKIDEVLMYMNSKLNEICDNYNVSFVNIYSLIKEDSSYINNEGLSKSGNSKVSEEIINKINDTLLK